MKKDSFIKKFWLISKTMTSQTRQQIITIDILPNISKSNDNQVMKLGHLVKYSVKNIFLCASFRK